MHRQYGCKQSEMRESFAYVKCKYVVVDNSSFHTKVFLLINQPIFIQLGMFMSVFNNSAFLLRLMVVFCPHSYKQPLLLVSLDGLRAEYLQTWSALIPVLDKLSQCQPYIFKETWLPSYMNKTSYMSVYCKKCEPINCLPLGCLWGCWVTNWKLASSFIRNQNFKMKQVQGTLQSVILPK